MRCYYWQGVTCKKRQNLIVTLYMLDTFSLLICTFAKVALLIVGNFILSTVNPITFLAFLHEVDSRLINKFRYVFLYNLVITCMSFYPFICCGLAARRIVGGIQVIRQSGILSLMKTVFIYLTCAKIVC